MVRRFEFQSYSTLISVHPPTDEDIVHLYPGHNFFCDLTLDSYQKFWWPPDKKLDFMYTPGQWYQHCNYPYLYTPTDEDSVH